MAAKRRIKARHDARQKAFEFSRPRTLPAPPARRPRHRKGRIRAFLKHTALAALMCALPFTVWAWNRGHVTALADQARDEAITLSLDAGLALERVAAEGQVRTPDAAILEALGVSAGDAMVALDMETLRGRVEALPWVGEAVVSREWPATLRVWIEERTPFARWQIGGEVVLVDETAAAIDAGAVEDFVHLPLIVGPGAPENAAALFAVIRRDPALSDHVVAAVRIGERRWDLEFDNGMRLKLPEETDAYGVASAWRAFTDMEKEKGVMRLDVEVVDLRLPDRVVLRLTPEGMKAYRTEDQVT